MQVASTYLCQNAEWLRVVGELVEDDRREARQSMLNEYPSLQCLYSADDDKTNLEGYSNNPREMYLSM